MVVEAWRGREEEAMVHEWCCGGTEGGGWLWEAWRREEAVVEAWRGREEAAVEAWMERGEAVEAWRCRSAERGERERERERREK